GSELSPLEALRKNYFWVLVQETESRRHDSDHFPRSRVDGDGPSDQGSVLAKAPVPVPVREDHGFGRAWRIVVRRESPSKSRLTAERSESSIGHDHRPDFLGLADSCNGGGLGVPDPEIPERLIAFPVDEIHRRRQPDVVRGMSLEFRGVPDANESVGLRIWQRPDQNGVENTESRRRRADAKGQGRYGSYLETGRFAQRADGKPQVPNHPLEPSDAVHLTNLLARGKHTAELAPRRDARFIFRHPRTAVPFNQQLEVRFDFVPGLLVHASARQHGAKPL